MKRFKTYVITKKTLIKASIIIVSITASVLTVVLSTNNRNDDEVISVFSESPDKILDKGLISDKNQNEINDILTEILGFDAQEPDSIIQQSSASFNEINKADPTEKPIEKPTEAPKQKEYRELPTHNEIIKSVGLKINNATDYTVDIDKLCSENWGEKLNFSEPEVLIIHTHTTECYIGDEMTGESERTTNEAYNMCKIGDAVADSLNRNGVQTIHDKTIHDYPTYQGAYTRAAKTIEKNLSQYPSIKVVLDIHRDAYIYPDGSKLKVSNTVNGENIAQVMLVLGTDSMGLSHEFWQSNLILGAKIQNTAEIMYPGLMRPLNLRRERFNMNATKGSLLLEIGSNGNTLNEALKSAEYIGNAIAAALING